jgi:hypothetical protein
MSEPTQPRSSSPSPFPLRWAVILMGALLAGLVIGGLTFLQAVNWPAAVLAGLVAAGAAVPVLHSVLGSDDSLRR